MTVVLMKYDDRNWSLCQIRRETNRNRQRHRYKSVHRDLTVHGLSDQLIGREIPTGHPPERRIGKEANMMLSIMEYKGEFTHLRTTRHWGNATTK